jgi:tetratricopeptide (TPR) repeat protein
VPAAVIAAATLVVFWPALCGGWLWDDGLEITDNPLLRQAGGWWREWTAPAGLDYLPLKGSLQWIEWQCWGAQPLGYHAVNVGLHLLGALLLWRVLAQLGVAAAWWGGLLFAVHPAVVESVAWVSEFKNVVALPPLLLSLSAFLKFDAARWIAPNPAVERVVPNALRVPRAWLAAAVGWFAVALLCKASAVMFPVCLLVYIGWRRGRIGWADLAATAPFFLLSALCGVVTWEFQWHRAMATVPIAGEWRAHIAQSGWTLLAYLRTAFMPVHLAPVYGAGPGWLLSANSLLGQGFGGRAGRAGLGWMPWLAVAMGFAWCWHRRAGWGRHAGFAGAWFVLNLLPVLGFIPMAYLRVSPRADHLEYLALAGWAGGMAAAWGAIRAWVSAGRAQPPGALAEPKAQLAGPEVPLADPKTQPARPAVALAVPKAQPARPEAAIQLIALQVSAALVVLVFVAASRSYAARFRSEEALWTYGAAREPNAWLARSNLGKLRLDQGRLDAAQTELAAAARLQPQSAEVRSNWGNALERLNRPAEALAQYQEAVRLDPRFAGVHYNLGRAWLQRGRLPAALAELRTAVTLDPDYAAAHNNLGVALARSGDLPTAEAEYRTALRIAPAFPEAHLNLGNAYFRDRRIDDAVAEYRAALHADPGYAAAQHNLDAVLAYQAQHPAAR